MRLRALCAIAAVLVCGCRSVTSRTDRTDLILLVEQEAVEEEATVDETCFVINCSFDKGRERAGRGILGYEISREYESFSFGRVSAVLGVETAASMYVKPAGRCTLVETAPGQLLFGRLVEGGMMLRLRVESFDPEAGRGTLAVEFACAEGGKVTFHMSRKGIPFGLNKPLIVTLEPLAMLGPCPTAPASAFLDGSFPLSLQLQRRMDELDRQGRSLWKEE